MDKINTASVKRLCYISGIIRETPDTIEALKIVFNSLVKDIVNKSLVVCQYQHRRVLTTGHLEHAFSIRYGEKFYASGNPVNCVCKNKSAILKAVKLGEDCVVVSRKPFSNCVKGMMEFEGYKFGEHFLGNLQYLVETKMRELLMTAYDFMQVAHIKTLTTNILTMAQKYIPEKVSSHKHNIPIRTKRKMGFL